MTKIRIINAPTPDTLAMLKRRMPAEARSRLERVRIDAIGLFMLPVPDLYYYADRASKSAIVAVAEIFGSCPQHITTLAVFGEVGAVNEAVRIIEEDASAF